MRNLRFLAIALALACALPAFGAEPVRIGYTRNSGDAGLYIAEAKGYFKAENLAVTMTHIDTGARMVAPLGTGELDVGSLTGGVGLFNAAARKIENRIVADRTRSAPGYNFQTLFLRKDLIDSGRVKTYADLKGLKIAVAAPGIYILSVINQAMKKGGLRYSDAEIINLGYAQQAAAFRNKTIDASIMVEPFATSIVAAGDGVRFAPTEDFYPGNQGSFMVFGDRFAREKPDVARAFMRAYVRALRDYNDAIENGRWRGGPAADAVVAAIAHFLDLQPTQVRALAPHACDPDGGVNIESMRTDLAFFRETGEVTSPTLKVEDLVDMSFVTAAVSDLGPYRRAP